MRPQSLYAFDSALSNWAAPRLTAVVRAFCCFGNPQQKKNQTPRRIESKEQKEPSFAVWLVELFARLDLEHQFPIEVPAEHVCVCVLCDVRSTTSGSLAEWQRKRSSTRQARPWSV